MGRRPPIPTRTDALFPYTTLFRSCFAQVHQLIYGGREPALRAPATVDALAALAQAGRIAPDIAARLADHYAVLRRIEHRLQMIEDQQTHSLPVQGAALDAVARLDGQKDGAALIAQIGRANV